jgi:hypothetical protein
MNNFYINKILLLIYNNMSVNKIVNITNPTPILKQERSRITTNPFIPNEQRILELEQLDKSANKIIEESYNKNKTNSIANLNLRDVSKNISSSFIGISEDLFNKPKDVKWVDYIFLIFQKDQRYAYIGVVLLMIAFYMMIVKNSGNSYETPRSNFVFKINKN